MIHSKIESLFPINFNQKNHQKSQGACDVGPTSADYEKKMMLASFLLLDVKFPIIDNQTDHFTLMPDFEKNNKHFAIRRVLNQTKAHLIMKSR